MFISCSLLLFFLGAAIVIAAIAYLSSRSIRIALAAGGAALVLELIGMLVYTLCLRGRG